jgi:8-oxo-dGTP pyrophosphatase MutT (NUDIX family)
VNRLWQLGYRGLQWWWKVRRPTTVGVRVLLLRDRQVLLVRHTYQDQWFMPGGRVERGETLVDAVRREAAEEVGATLGELSLLGVYTNTYEGKTDHIAVLICHEFTVSGETDREIEQYAFYDLDALPEDVSPGTRRRIGEYVSGESAQVRRW